MVHELEVVETLCNIVKLGIHARTQKAEKVNSKDKPPRDPPPEAEELPNFRLILRVPALRGEQAQVIPPTVLAAPGHHNPL
jgi:hypothetical protein